MPGRGEGGQDFRTVRIDKNELVPRFICQIRRAIAQKWEATLHWLPLSGPRTLDLTAEGEESLEIIL
jgi:hypothetical protein